MTPLDYLKAVRGILDHLEKTQMGAVESAADLVVGALVNRGVVYCSEIGHGIQGDFINRAGGLCAVRHFHWNLSLTDPVPSCLKDRPRTTPCEPDLETVRLAVRAGNLRAGDAMLIGSVSGRNRAPVELALACRDLGAKTIGITSLAYTREVQPLHPSGKRLCDAVDVCIDSGAPFGDAAVEVPGYPIRLLPVSGVAADVAGWLVFGRVAEKMAQRGTPSSVMMSLNREGGREWYDRAQKDYEQRGY